MGKPQLEEGDHHGARRRRQGQGHHRAVQPHRVQLRAHQRVQGDADARASARRCCSSSTASRDQLSMELFLDDYTDPEGPTSLQQKETDPRQQAPRATSAKLLEIDRDLHAPPPVRFNWGPLEFTAVIEKLGRKVTMFHPDGTPARATLQRQLQGIPDAAPAARGSAARVGRQDQAPRRRRPRQPVAASRRASTTIRASGCASPKPTISTTRAKSSRATG